ncbi:MAG: TRAP transporter substrate-binding protein DctP [Bacillota bacterium]
MSKKLWFYFIVVVLLVALVTGCASPTVPAPAPAPEKAPAVAPAEEAKKIDPITLKAVSFLPMNHPLNEPLPMWIDMVKEATNGQVIIEWTGGPEVIPPLEQFDAVNRGVVDVNFNVAAYYENNSPIVRIMGLSRIKPWQEREVGFFDKMVEIHREIGVEYVGRWLTEGFHFYLNEPSQGIADLKGRSLRTRANYDRFMREIGVVPVSIDHGEVYTALERGIIQGFGWPILGVRNDGWTEVSKYCIDHPFFTSNNATILFNLNKFNSIPSDLQDIIIETTAAFEYKMSDHFAAAVAAERKKLEEEGVVFIKYPGDEGEKFVSIAHDVEWKHTETVVPGDLVAELRKLIDK